LTFSPLSVPYKSLHSPGIPYLNHGGSIFGKGNKGFASCRKYFHQGTISSESAFAKVTVPLVPGILYFFLQEITEVYAFI
jgi:hypothetical protein